MHLGIENGACMWYNAKSEVNRMDGILTIKDLAVLDKQYVCASGKRINVYNNYFCDAPYTSLEEVDEAHQPYITYDMGLNMVYFSCKEGEVIELKYPIVASGIITNGTIKCPSIKASIVYAENVITDNVLDVPCVVAKNSITANKIITNEVACGKGGLKTMYIEPSDKSMPMQIISEGTISCPNLSFPNKESYILSYQDVLSKNIKARRVDVRGSLIAETCNISKINIGSMMKTNGKSFTMSLDTPVPMMATLKMFKNCASEVILENSIFKGEFFKNQYNRVFETLKDAIIDPEILFERMARDNQTTDAYGRAK